MNPLLDVQNLSIEFPTRRGGVRAVDDISFALAAGETLAVVGELGSGKSTAALEILGAYPRERRPPRVRPNTI